MCSLLCLRALDDMKDSQPQMTSDTSAPGLVFTLKQIKK